LKIVRSEVKKYDKFILLDIHEDKPGDWAASDATNMRVHLPSLPEYEVFMMERGFFWADRTIGTSINISGCSLDLNRLIRMKVDETSNYKEEIANIAKSSFTYDRRFHIRPQCDMSVAGLLLQEWIDAVDKCFVCMHKDAPVGFLALKETEPDTLFVHLAAVMEQYRTAGAAMSLYAKALQAAKERGYKKLNGRISTLNMSVMNLYAYLGARFSDPEDIFLKELKQWS
jgi:GNAT superfamily N-acetyltransferase